MYSLTTTKYIALCEKNYLSYIYRTTTLVRLSGLVPLPQSEICPKIREKNTQTSYLSSLLSYLFHFRFSPFPSIFDLVFLTLTLLTLLWFIIRDHGIS